MLPLCKWTRSSALALADAPLSAPSLRQWAARSAISNPKPARARYAAWPARHRESDNFIKMIGLVREISSQKIRRQLAWTYSDPALQVWNLAQTKSYLVKLAKANSTKKHKAVRCPRPISPTFAAVSLCSDFDA